MDVFDGAMRFEGIVSEYRDGLRPSFANELEESPGEAVACVRFHTIYANFMELRDCSARQEG